ncbi:hypothetical protein BJX68DRAFT_243962 [Aspergillus pseudodeflectus]|uniref:Uncharacterized protein n=1 Tax=Aspergillus pseudodeflectus TaxID=176178 RepID=A0ABR4JTQ3_9EURO
MVYYNYLWVKQTGQSADQWHYIVVSADRNTADTFFRILDTNRSFTIPRLNTSESIKDLTRVSPQLWTYDCVDASMPARLNFVVSGNAPEVADKIPAFADVMGKIKIVHMGPINTLRGDASGWTIPTPKMDFPLDGEDWLSGYSFYVRRRGFPNVYWYNDGGLITLSQHKRSRFIVTVQNSRLRPSAKIPIIAKDKLKIQWVGGDSTRRPLDIIGGFLAVSTGETKLFDFSDLSQRFSILWAEDGSSEPNNPYKDVKITWSSESGSNNDSFELCEGMPVGELGGLGDNDEY